MILNNVLGSLVQRIYQSWRKAASWPSQTYFFEQYPAQYCNSAWASVSQ